MLTGQTVNGFIIMVMETIFGEFDRKKLN